MSEETTEITEYGKWQTKVLVIGTVVGALVGLIGAVLLIQRQEDDKPPEFSAGEGVKLGVAAFAFLRAIANI